MSLSVTSFKNYSKNLGASLVAQPVKKICLNVGYIGSITGLGRSPGGGNGNPLQYSNPMDRGDWGVTVDLEPCCPTW